MCSTYSNNRGTPRFDARAILARIQWGKRQSTFIFFSFQQQYHYQTSIVGVFHTLLHSCACTWPQPYIRGRHDGNTTISCP